MSAQPPLFGQPPPPPARKGKLPPSPPPSYCHAEPLACPHCGHALVFQVQYLRFARAFRIWWHEAERDGADWEEAPC